MDGARRVTPGPGDAPPRSRPDSQGPGSVTRTGERADLLSPVVPDQPVGLRRVRQGFFDRGLLRFGVTPFLVVMDACAFLLAARLVGRLDGAALVLLGLTLVLYGTGGLYRSRLTLSAIDDLPALVGRAFVAATIATAVGVVIDAAGANTDLLWLAALFCVTVVVMRTLGYGVVRAVRRRRFIAHPALILGAGRVGGHLAELLRQHPEYGLRPVGFLDSDPLLTPEERPVPLLGGHERLASAIVEFGVHDVVIAFGSGPESHMVDVIRTCDRLDCEIFFVPRLFELHSGGLNTDHVWGMPLVRLRRPAFRSLSWRLKRVLDATVAGLALLLLSPVMALCALAVRLEGGKGVIFRQERIGIDGRAFPIYKFRSMRPSNETESQTQWNIAGDDRVGRVGRILRKTSLDELPQLWNVMRGQMSLVGPRPERPHFVEQFTHSYPRYMARHRVPAGLTGWAQIHGLRGDTSIEDRARFDNFYIENWSMWLDVKILLRTVMSVLRASGNN